MLAANLPGQFYVNNIPAKLEEAEEFNILIAVEAFVTATALLYHASVAGDLFS
jgi:hypothetical protein